MAKRNEEEIKEFIINGVNNNENTQQSQPDLSENQKQISKELKDQLNNANDEYDHLFNEMNATATAATHPAMEIFRLPAEKEININDTADELRRKAKAPQSRDQSQQRKASSGGFHEEEHNRQQRLINSAGPSSMATSTTNLISSRQQNILSKGNSQSQLILELIGSEEEGPTYYEIPAEISNEPAVVKLMQSGKKLHIQNSHILVAVKAQGRVICSVCNKRIGGNFSSRQAYQCRDCRIVCHKNCHQQIDWICENISSLSNLHVEEVDWVEFLRHHHLREFISVGNL
ncbi:Phorbol-ester/DAG-type domain-containing protein [Meloidogyne graminicola]|uniref:Phorbol-ester/DAG-type domain-containing protein n=1 Tax=Meloidogyne graminicola TaxID=189291 RepID=A0A8S9ZEM8_9BILA|nr:Phorbol-ester/DAG-type domain-containing protein [Meloidogyne graminicola]